MMKLALARALAGIVFVCGGSAMQLLLRKSAERGIADALLHWPLLWLVYLLSSLLIGEHLHRFLKKGDK